MSVIGVRAVLVTVLVLTKCISLVNAHILLAHPSSWGFNVTVHTPTAYPGDNRPCTPLRYRPFKGWWFHGFLEYPPHPQDSFQLEAGTTAVVETVCNKDASSYWESGNGKFTQTGNMNSPCPGHPPRQYHTTGKNDTGGCALSIVYESDVNKVQPEDFVVFSIQQTCVWYRFTHFDVPAHMPHCPHGKCICQWTWQHRADSGTEQMYSNMFRCGVTGGTSPKRLAKPKVPRLCGGDPDRHIPPNPKDCVSGAKQPFYWLQLERNNMFEPEHHPPLYNDRYNFKQGAQNDIFEDGPPMLFPASNATSTSQAKPMSTPSTRTTTPKTKGGPRHSPSTAPKHTPTSHCENKRTEALEARGRPGVDAHRKLIRKHGHHVEGDAF